MPSRSASRPAGVSRRARPPSASPAARRPRPGLAASADRGAQPRRSAAARSRASARRASGPGGARARAGAGRPGGAAQGPSTRRSRSPAASARATGRGPAARGGPPFFFALLPRVPPLSPLCPPPQSRSVTWLVSGWGRRSGRLTPGRRSHRISVSVYPRGFPYPSAFGSLPYLYPRETV